MKTLVVGLSCFLTGAAIAFGSASFAQITREPYTPKDLKPIGAGCDAGFSRENVSKDGQIYECYKILPAPDCDDNTVLGYYGLEQGNRLEYLCSVTGTN